MAEHRKSYYTAAFNSATMYAKASEYPRARELTEIAAREPSLAEKVGKLRGALERVGAAR